MKTKIIKELFLTFFKIGLFTFGGGYAMIPLIEEEICEKKKWISKDELTDIVIISESTPGSLSINIATFVGMKMCSYLGSLFSTLGLVIPSFVIISLITKCLSLFSNKYISYALLGIKGAVIALIINALVSMFKECDTNLFSYLLMLLGIFVIVFLKINAFFVIVIGAIVGLIYCFIRKEI